jgi:hypothetical protein
MKISWFGRKTRGVEATLGETSVRSRGLSNLIASPDELRMAAAGGTKAVDAGAIVKAVRQRPIVFRQLFPPPPEPGMSFYGGAPIGPANMPWPRSEVDGLPLPFIMQWGASTLAAHDTTGLMPRSGALYLFSTLAWRDHFECRLLYAPADGGDWVTLTVPDDLPPALGDGVWQSPLASRDVPIEQQSGLQLLPCWPFQPLDIDYPHSIYDGDEEALYWQESVDVKELLLRAQDPSAAPQAAPRAKLGSSGHFQHSRTTGLQYGSSRPRL